MKKKEKANKFTQGKNPLTKNSKQKKNVLMSVRRNTAMRF